MTVTPWRLVCIAVLALPAGVGAQEPARCDMSAVTKRLVADRAGYLAAFNKRPELRSPLHSPPTLSSLVLLMAEGSPLVHDHFVCSVAAHRDTGAVYVIRSGGYAGVWDVMGPVAQIAERPVCAPPPPASQAAAPQGSGETGGVPVR